MPKSTFTLLAVLALSLAAFGCGGGSKVNAISSGTGTPSGGGGSGTGGSTGSTPCDPKAATASVVSVRDVRFGALGDGVTDDTAAIQKAANAVAGTGGTLLVPGGTYLINTANPIAIGSGMTVQFAAGAIFQAIPTAAGTYTILSVANASNVNILGGTLKGDFGTPSAHLGTTGEWGMGLAITGSKNVAIAGVTTRDCWGDGFNVSGACSGISFCTVTADHNRRSGLTLTNADTVTVQNSTFTNTGGTLPEAGLNIEPNPGETVNNVTITACTFANNAVGGIQVSVPLANTGKAFVTNVAISGSTVTGNGTDTATTYYRNAILVSNCSGHHVSNNTVSSNLSNGILVDSSASGITVTNNTVQNNGGYGILADASQNTVTGNTVSGNGH